MKKIIILFASFLTVSAILLSCKKEKTYILEVKDGVKYIHNLKPKHDHPTAGLEFVQQIGELEPEDENYLFSFPISVAEDEEGNIYIMDIKECCIKKFTADGVYMSRFGRPGQGPGELEYPETIDCHGRRLLVTTASAQFHLFDLDGKYIERFRLSRYQGLRMKFLSADKVVGYSMSPRGENNKDNRILKIFDLEGNLLHDFGEPFLVDNTRSSWVANFLQIAVDNKDNIYVAFSYQNRVEKYSGSGDLLMKIDRELPFDLEYKYKKAKMEVLGKAREYMAQDFPLVNRGIGVDSQGRIWVLTFKKEVPKDIKGEDFIYQNYLKFDVHSEDGILLTEVPVPDGMERFDNYTMCGDRVYFADPYGQACVYVYKIVSR
jgi:sugar lactone lactonase YvrE